MRLVYLNINIDKDVTESLKVCYTTNYQSYIFHRLYMTSLNFNRLCHKLMISDTFLHALSDADV
jgi:hypothetical protein